MSDVGTPSGACGHGGCKPALHTRACEGTTSTLTNAALVPEARWLTDRYEFLAELGRGGMGIVYLARELSGGRTVAIKLLATPHAASTDAALRFAREARTVAALDHPQIVRTLAIEELSGGAIAIVSEYIPGQTLRALLRETGPLPFDQAAMLLRDIASALAHAHRFRIVHRDVKPENIFVEQESGRALLADFGIARPLDTDTELTAAGSALGTPTYMAPEQVKGGTLDERADVYSLGLVGWEMLAGSRPWEGETLYDVLHKQQHERLPSLAALRPDIPMYLLVAIEGAVAKHPRERWADGGELLSQLTPTPATLPPRRNREDNSWIDEATVPVRVPAAPATPAAEPVTEPVTAAPSEPVPVPMLEIPVAPTTAREPALDASTLDIPIVPTPVAEPAPEASPSGSPEETHPSWMDRWSAARERTSPDVGTNPFSSPAPRAAQIPREAASARSDVAPPVLAGDVPDDERLPLPTTRARRKPMSSVRGMLVALVLGVFVALMFLTGTWDRLTAGGVASSDSLSLAEPMPSDSAMGSELAVRDSVARDANPGAVADTAVPPPGAVIPAAASPPVVPPSAPPASRTAPRPAPPAAATTPPRVTAPNPPARPAPSSPAPAAAATSGANADARCRTATTAAQRACLIAGIDRNDVDLNRTYQALIAQLRREAGGVREPRAVLALRVEQRAWVADRDRACRSSAGAGSSPLWGAERIPCFARMSEEREAVLRSRLQESAGGNQA